MERKNIQKSIEASNGRMIPWIWTNISRISMRWHPCYNTQSINTNISSWVWIHWKCEFENGITIDLLAAFDTMWCDTKSNVAPMNGNEKMANKWMNTKWQERKTETKREAFSHDYLYRYRYTDTHTNAPVIHLYCVWLLSTYAVSVVMVMVCIEILLFSVRIMPYMLMILCSCILSIRET